MDDLGDDVMPAILTMHFAFGLKFGIFFTYISTTEWMALRDYNALPDSLLIPSVVWTSQQLMLIAVRLATGLTRPPTAAYLPRADSHDGHSPS